MTITTTAKNLREGDRLQGMGEVIRSLPVNRVFHQNDGEGEYPEIELADGSTLPIRSWATELEVIR
jgi:hypothetical protein